MLEVTRKVSDNDFTVQVAARRNGDAPKIISEATDISIKTGWEAKER